MSSNKLISSTERKSLLARKRNNSKVRLSPDKEKIPIKQLVKKCFENPLSHASRNLKSSSLLEKASSNPISTFDFLRSIMHPKPKKPKQKPSLGKSRKNTCTIEVKNPVNLRKRISNISIPTCKHKREVETGLKTHKTSLQQVKRIYGKELNSSKNQDPKGKGKRKVKSSAYLTILYDAYYSNYYDRPGVTSMHPTPTSFSKLRNLRMYMDMETQRKNNVYSSFSNYEKKRGKPRSMPPKNKSMKGTKEFSSSYSKKIKRKILKQIQPMLVKGKRRKCEKKLKEGEISIKKFISSPKIRNSAKKTIKSKANNFYLRNEKYSDSKTKRTMFSNSVKNSTRVSENYSNMNTSGARKRTYMGSGKNNIHSSRSVKRNNNSNYFYQNHSNSNVLNSLERLPVLKI